MFHMQASLCLLNASMKPRPVLIRAGLVFKEISAYFPIASSMGGL